jgi:hypothetical protein
VDSVIDEMTILDKFYRLLDGARNAVVVVALILVVAAVLLGGEHDPAVGVQPAAGDRNYAAGRRV